MRCKNNSPSSVADLAEVVFYSGDYSLTPDIFSAANGSGYSLTPFPQPAAAATVLLQYSVFDVGLFIRNDDLTDGS